MTTVVYLPLDERPCNAQFPRQIADLTDLNFISPPLSILGKKKIAAEQTRLTDWLKEQTVHAGYLILSVDMLVYGGIVPSRLHSLTSDECKRRLDFIGQLKQQNPGLKIFAYNLIMRAPAYNGSDEEPDYYEEHGRNIFRYGWLQDKMERQTLTQEETAEREKIHSVTPQEVLEDFVARRKVNAYVNQLCVSLAKEGIIDKLIIPLDDNAQYGFTSQEQRNLLFSVESANLMDRVLIYPGADEIGCILFTNVFCEIKQFQPEVFIRYSSTQGPFIIPKYEDRSLNESIKSHVTAAGAFIGNSTSEADFILMVNSPPVGQYETAETSQMFSQRHRAYFSEIHYGEFVNAIRTYSERGKMIALADVATCNGADHTLMKLIAKLGLLKAISAYAGWNTSGNTLGTVIAHSVVESYYRAMKSKDEHRLHKSKEFYVYRLIEDWGYQALVRGDISSNHLEALGGNNFQISHIREQLLPLLERKLLEFVETYLQDLAPEDIRLEQIDLPWNRMFEVGFQVQLNSSVIQ